MRDDFNLPGQVHAVMVRSPVAHARIVSIDAAPALADEQVLAVLTGADYADDGLGEIVGGYAGARRDGQPLYRPPRPALTRDVVRHVGQIVAVVIARSRHAAQDGAELVAVGLRRATGRHVYRRCESAGRGRGMAGLPRQ